MNLSRILVGVNQSKWRQLLPFSAEQNCQRRQLLLVTFSHNHKPVPLSLTSTACHSRCRLFPLNTEQTRHGIKWFLSGSRLWLLVRSLSHCPRFRARCLCPGHMSGTQTLGKCFHTREGNRSQQGRGNAQTPALNNEIEHVNPQTQVVVLQSEEQAGRSEKEGKTQDVGTMEEDDVKLLSQQILRQAEGKDVMVRSVPVQKVEQLVQGLRQSGWNSASILSVLTSQPSLLHHRHSLLRTMQLLLTLGFDVPQVRAIMEQLPAVLQISKPQISQAVDTLRQLGFGEETLYTVMSHNPSLLLSSKPKLGERIEALKQMFKTEDVVTLCLRCPRMLTDAWDEVQAKFDYVFHQMGVTQRQMVHASLFNHSLSHIKKRHTFLVRAGLYNTAKRKEGERSPNATLDLIIASSDKKFCRKFGAFEVAEYHAFCQLFDKEQAVLHDSDSDDVN